MVYINKKLLEIHIYFNLIMLYNIINIINIINYSTRLGVKLMKKTPIIFDCDTGTDDAIALMSALYSEELDIRAITTVAGNVALEHTSRNTLNLVDYLGFDIKVAKGEEKPLERKLQIATCHGDNGLGGIILPASTRDFYEKNAVDTIYEEALKLNGELHIVAVGPLTNIAKALIKYPDLKDMVKYITIMGGAIKGGNVTQVAEFNIFVDPEAARIVFESGIPMTMVGLDVTERTAIQEEEMEDYRNINSKAGKLTYEILQYMNMRNKKWNQEGAIMHDGLALGTVIHPEFITTKGYYVNVETKGEFTCGHTFCDRDNKLNKEANCNVAIDVRADEYKKWLLNVISNTK